MWWKALLALVVAVALIIGVNYANDYSDGIRGTDDVRAGPLRLVGSKVATPRAVLTAAVVSLGVGAVAGLVLAIVSQPWLIAVGVACIAGAWLYTGGSKPYGYQGFGEVAVFVFFGLVAVLGTQYTQALRIDWVGPGARRRDGCLSSAVLVANNLRDIPTDKESGKITLAVRLGDARTRRAISGAGGGGVRADAGADARHAVVCGRLGRGATGGAGGRAGAKGIAAARTDPGAARYRADDAGVAIAVACALAFGAGF